MEPIGGAVETVATALADYVNLATRRAQERYVLVSYFGAELIDAFHADGNDGLFRRATRDNVVSDVNPVHHDAVLIASRPRNRATTIAKAHLIAVIGCRTRLKRE